MALKPRSAVGPPTDEQVRHLIEQTAYRLIGLLQRRGVLDDAQVDAQADQEPVLAAIAAASVQDLVATGERAGRRVRRVLSDPAEGIHTVPLCFASRGFSVPAEPCPRGFEIPTLLRCHSGAIMIAESRLSRARSFGTDEAVIAGV